MSNTFESCPFFPQHRVQSHRMAKHIFQCKLKYRGPHLEKCLYNAQHYIPEGNMDQHLESCESYLNSQRSLNRGIPRQATNECQYHANS